MRTKKSFINMITSYISQIIIILLGFISRRVLIYSVGVEYLGINGLMTNILTIFSLAESGIGIVIGFSLYEPLAVGDKEKIKSLMYFYKRAYEILAVGTAVIGIAFYPFLPIFLKGNTTANAELIYFLFLFSSVASYLFSYKVTLNNSDQNKYVFTIANTINQILVLIIKIVILYYTENYILFLVIDIFSNIIKNIIFSYMVDRRYPYLKEKNIAKLDEKTKTKMFTNIKALFIGKIGYIISQCSDNLVISSMVSITSLGLYSNYTTLVTSVQGFIKTFTGSITASMGNLIASEDKKKTYMVYKKIDFINHWLYTFSSICLLCLIEPFISIWIGHQFILSKSILIVTVLQFYFTGINLSVDMVKSAAGLFHPDRYIPTIEAIVNMVISITLAKYIGLLGVLIGTLFSFLLFSFWIKPYLVFNRVFEVSVKKYFKDILIKLLISLGSAIITYILVISINVSNNMIVSFILKAGVAVITPNIVLLICLHKKDEFKFFTKMIRKGVKR